MIEAKQEIIDILNRKIRENTTLDDLTDDDIREIVEILFDNQFTTTETKLKKSLLKKITQLSQRIVRQETKRVIE